MKKLLLLFCVPCVILGITAMQAWSSDSGTDQSSITINIAVSPQTIVKSAFTRWVTVHTDIPYSLVVKDTVALEGIGAKLTMTDARGHLVAKFEVDAIKAIVFAPSATLTLTGMTTDGDSFSGSDTVRVTD